MEGEKMRTFAQEHGGQRVPGRRRPPLTNLISTDKYTKLTNRGSNFRTQLADPCQGMGTRVPRGARQKRKKENLGVGDDGGGDELGAGAPGARLAAGRPEAVEQAPHPRPCPPHRVALAERRVFQLQGRDFIRLAEPIACVRACVRPVADRQRRRGLRGGGRRRGRGVSKFKIGAEEGEGGEGGVSERVEWRQAGRGGPTSSAFLCPRAREPSLERSF